MSRHAFGLPYMGSKNILAEKILDILPPAHTLVDLFAGGCAITHAAILSGKYQRIIANDITDAPQLFLRAARGEIATESARWISREEFHAAKSTDPLIRHLWSFGNRGDTYAFAREIEPYMRAVFTLLTAKDFTERRYAYRAAIVALFRYLRTQSGGSVTLCEKRYKGGKVCEAFSFAGKTKPVPGTLASNVPLERLQRVSSLECLQRVSSIERLQRVSSLECLTVTRLDYREVTIPPGAIIYADPPYNGCEEYEGAENFDSRAFFDWARTCAAPVFISEYSAPADFQRVAQFSVQRRLAHNRKHTHATENLYANPPALEMLRSQQADLFTEAERSGQ